MQRDYFKELSEARVALVGPGCVVGRQFDILSSMGLEDVTLVKWGGSPDSITTIELQELEERIGRTHPMYAA